MLTTDAGLKQGNIPGRGREVSRNGVKVHYAPQVPGYGIRSPALEAAIGEFAENQDLIHVTAIWQRTGPAACRAARAAGVPCVISPRGALSPYSWKRGRWKKLVYYLLYERRNLSEAAGFHYTSAMEAAECESFRFGKPSCVVPNGIDFQRWRRNGAAGAAWRKRNGIPADARVMLYSGRMHHKKGLDLLPEVLSRLSKPDWRIVFVGGDDDATGQKLEVEFRRKGLADRVRFLPWVDSGALAETYSGADILVLPSRHENFGNVALEAAACGCWILASEKVGIARQLAELGAGECLPLNVDAWVGTIANWRSRDAGPSSRVIGTFDIRNTAESMETFYRSLPSAAR